MKVGDLVRCKPHFDFASNSFSVGSRGVVIAEAPVMSGGIYSVSVLWASGKLAERVPPRILEVINESR